MPAVATKPPAEEIQDFGVNWAAKYATPVPLMQRHLACAYHNIGWGSFYHRKEIITKLWPDYEWHAWNVRRLEAWCESNFTIWIGPAGSAKSTDAGVFALEYWIEAPFHTAVMVCSTTMKMLRKRIWSEFSKYHQKLPKGVGPVGELIDSDTLIRWKKGDAKHGIFGLAIEEGPVEEAVNNLIGVHTTRVLVILDELQGVREAIMGAMPNIAKNPVPKVHAMGNPESMRDLLGRRSTPVNGWDSVVRMETEHWEIDAAGLDTKGRADFFHGRKSPASLDPAFARRNPWMINNKQIDAHLNSMDVGGNENDPRFCSQSIGWWPALGLESTVLDLAIVNTFRCREKAIWTHGFRKFACFDPNFEGGDGNALYFGRMGESEDAETGLRWVIAFDERISVPIDSTSTQPIHYQIVDHVTGMCRVRDIPPDMLALDSTGEGGGLVSIFQATWGPVFGVEFGGKPSDRPANDGTDKTCADVYDRRVSELNLQVRKFALCNGLRGLDQEAVTQFCARRTYYKNKKFRVEPKTTPKGSSEKGFKERMGYSPNASDAVCVGVALCEEHGAVAHIPGQHQPRRTMEQREREIIESQDEFSPENYLVGYSYE